VEIIASAPARMGLSEIGGWASRMERIGFDVIHIAETSPGELFVDPGRQPAHANPDAEVWLALQHSLEDR
jgi:hypothetical protein